MTRVETYVFTVLLFLAKQNLGKDLPSFIQVCQHNDPKTTTCMLESVEKLRPYLKTGVPEHNIPRLEPLVLEDLITENFNGVEIAVTNVSAYGASDFHVKYLDVNLNGQVELHVDIPELRIFAHFSVNGNILRIAVKGEGDLEANITDCASQTNLRMERFDDDDGVPHLRFTDIDLKVQVGGGQARLTNLFNGDKTLLTIINELINRNFQGFLKELLPLLEKGLSKKFLEIANNIVEPYTLYQLFPR